MRRELQVALLLVLAGSALLLVAAGRPWLVVALEPMPPLPAQEQVRTGFDLAAGPRPARSGRDGRDRGAAATRRPGRVAVGVLLAAAGGGAVAATVRFLAVGVAPGTGTGWPYAALGGLLLLGAGGLSRPPAGAAGRRCRPPTDARRRAPSGRSRTGVAPGTRSTAARTRRPDPPPAPGWVP